MKFTISKSILVVLALGAGHSSLTAQIALAIDINSNNRSFTNTTDMSPTYTAGGFTGWDMLNQDTLLAGTTATFGDYTVSMRAVGNGSGSRDRINPVEPFGDQRDFFRDVAQVFSLSSIADNTTVPTDNAADALKISGLSPNSSYTLQLWGFDLSNNNGVTFRWWDMNNAGGTLLGTITNSPNTPIATDLGTYTLAGTVQTNALGEIVMGTTSSGTRVILNGFSVAAIPEPSTYAVLAGLLALGVVAWRRRRA